ncbi:MAG: hypothetical protein QNK37_32130 [Acidobacteriota bacterium]|nr:hypothetical protein [Acidobacteriota bacterium]
MRKLVVCLVAFGFVLPPVWSQSFTADLYAKNPAYVVVTVSTDGLLRGEYLRDVVIKVRFVDQEGEELGTFRMAFTDEERWTLDRNRVYRRYFLHGQNPDGLQVGARCQAVKAVTVGSKSAVTNAHGVVIYPAYKPSLFEARAIVIGDVPDARTTSILPNN